MKTSLVLASFTLLIALLLIPLGHAVTTVPISGSFTTTVTSETVNQFGNFLVISEGFSLTLVGSLVGTTVATATIIVNLSTGNGVFFGTQTFTGTLFASSPGTLQLAYSASFTGTSFNGQFIAYGGTGGLSGVTIQGTIQGTLNVNGIYSGFATTG